MVGAMVDITHIASLLQGNRTLSVCVAMCVALYVDNLPYKLFLLREKRHFAQHASAQHECVCEDVTTAWCSPYRCGSRPGLCPLS